MKRIKLAAKQEPQRQEMPQSRFLPPQMFNKLQKQKETYNMVNCVRVDLREKFVNLQHKNPTDKRKENVFAICNVEKTNERDAVRIKYGKQNQWQSTLVKNKPSYTGRFVISNVIAHKKRDPNGDHPLLCLDEDCYDEETEGLPLPGTMSQTVGRKLYGNGHKGDMIGLIIRFPVSKREQAIAGLSLVLLRTSSVFGIPMVLLKVQNADFDGDTDFVMVVSGCLAICATKELLTSYNVPHSGFDFVEHPIAELVCYYYMLYGRNIEEDMMKAYCKCLVYNAPYRVYSKAYRKLESKLVQQLSALNVTTDEDALNVNVIDLIPSVAEELGKDTSKGIVKIMIDSKCSRLNNALIYQINNGIGNLMVEAVCSENLEYLKRQDEFCAFQAPPNYNMKQNAKTVDMKSNMIGGFSIHEMLISAQLARSSIVATKIEITKPGSSPGRLMLNLCNVIVSEIFSCHVKDSNTFVVTNATRVSIWVKPCSDILNLIMEYDEEEDNRNNMEDRIGMSKNFENSLFGA